VFVEVEKYYFLFGLFAMSANFIQKITVGTKLKYSVKDRDQLCNLPFMKSNFIKYKL